jgi:hypothetical protein
MTGNKPRGLVLQARDRRLLQELAVMRVVDREQAKRVAGFGSTTRANVRLLALTRAGLLRRFFLGAGPGRKALYALSAKGAQLVGVPMRGPRRRNDEVLVADFFIQHQLTVNEIYCALKFGTLPQGVVFRRWVPFFAPLSATARFIPDGYVELETQSGVMAAFLEVDLGHESLTIWKQKIRNYLDFAVSGNYEREIGQIKFRVLVVLNSERRMHSIRGAAGKQTTKLFWFANLLSLRVEGLFASVWRRAQPGDPQPLV